MKSPTRSRSLQYADFIVSRSLDACQLNQRLNVLASSKDFTRSNSYAGFLSALPSNVSVKLIQILIKNLIKIQSYILNGMFTNTAMTSSIICTTLKICKVK